MIALTHHDIPVGLSVVVPTYNERDRLSELVARIFDTWHQSPEASIVGAAEVIVVDDNSPDGTGQHADDLARDHRDTVRVIHRPGKLGLGSAVAAGFAVARGDVIVVMDADLSHPPDVIPRLVRVQVQSGADFVVASRYVHGGRTRDWSIRRLMLSRMACRVAGQLTPIRDAMSGFFVIRRDRARAAQISVRGFKICLELLVRTRPRLVAEVPYEFVGRLAGKSKMGPLEAVRFVAQVRALRRFSAGFDPQVRPAYLAVIAEDGERARA